jgi:glycoside/pentoside/hexuronide:cation symporter, GPH family
LQATLLYFIKYVLNRESQSDLFMATIFVVAMVSLPVWNWVSSRFSKRTAFIYGIAFWCVVQLVLVMMNAVTPTPVIITLCILAGIGVAAAHVLPWAILPDAVEWDEWNTGERHEGMYYSLVTLIQKVASSLAVPMVLLILQITGYQPNIVEQTPVAIWGIRIAIGPIPAIMLLGGIFFALKYPLTRETFHQIQQQLEIRRKKKAMQQAENA